MSPSPRRFVLYSRPDCGLCEEMLSELAANVEAAAIGVDIVDVDSDPTARARFGHKIPVLLLDGELVCHGRMDFEELDKALAYHRRPV
jgi:predicted thioredoxin/glutaredoxin